MITHNSNYFALIAHRMNLSDYIKIARPDHWFKNLFMLPGVALALVLADVAFSDALFPLIIAVASTCLVASANYVINEYLDAEFDRFHPVKKHRPSAVGQIRGGGVVFEYILLGGTGLWLATLLTPEFVLFSAILLVMGV